MGLPLNKHTIMRMIYFMFVTFLAHSLFLAPGSNLRMNAASVRLRVD